MLKIDLTFVWRRQWSESILEYNESGASVLLLVQPTQNTCEKQSA